MRPSTAIACLAVVAGLVLAAPAEVGATSSSAPQLVATLTKAIAHKSYRPGTLITVAFTVGEPGKAPGAGVPAGSVFQVQLTRNPGPPTHMVPAAGRDGRYRVAIRWPGGRLLRVGIGGFLTGSSPTAASGFWLPVTTAPKSS